MNKPVPLASLAPNPVSNKDCKRSDAFMKSWWGVALLVLIVVFVVAFIVLWFTNPTWSQTKDGTGSPTGNADFALVSAWSICIAAGAALLYILFYFFMR